MSRGNSTTEGSLTVEEGMDCREADSRFFSLLNHESKLHMIVTKTSSLISCTLDGHEIIVNPKLYHQIHETWALGDRPFQKINCLPWNCHVRGSELLLSTLNNSSSIMFEMTRHNELNSIAKLKSIHLQHQTSYFNLNNAKEKAPIDGHTLVVQCNGNVNRISVHHTKLLCQCNKKASILPKSLVGDVPFELVQRDASMSTMNAQINNNNDITEDDLIVCDAIFSLESTCPMDCIRVRLQFRDRILVFECRSGSSQTNANTSNGNVSSSTGTKTSKSNQSDDLQTYRQQRNSSEAITPGQVSSGTDNLGLDSGSQAGWFSSLIEHPSTSCSFGSQLPMSSTTPAPKSKSQKLPSYSHPTTILRTRVRVTNFGVCIMPIMMTNYTCTYRFFW